MSSSYPPPVAARPAPQLSFREKVNRFWLRVTEGLELNQLWSQFESEARASYRLYSRDVAANTPEGLTKKGRHLHVVKEFFWAVFEKLSPARRVLLLVALILLIIPRSGMRYVGENGKEFALEIDLHFWAALVLLLLLILEIADRVAMLYKGRIVEEGTPETFQQSHASIHTRQPAAPIVDALAWGRATDEQRVARFAARQKMDLEAARKEVQRRMSAQPPEQEKIKAADYVIDNSGSLDETRRQVEEVFGKLMLEAN